MKLKIGTVLTIITLLFGSWLYIDKTKADAASVEKLEQRLDRKILKDDMREMQQRVWVLKDRFGEQLERASSTIKEEYRELVEELKEIKEEYRGK